MDLEEALERISFLETEVDDLKDDVRNLTRRICDLESKSNEN